MVNHKFVSFATVVALWTLVTLLNFNKTNSHTPKIEIQSRQRLCYFGRYVAKAKLFCPKIFARLSGLECSYGKIFIPVTEISVAKPEISVTGPGFSYEHIKILRRKEWRGEISETKPARLTRLI